MTDKEMIAEMAKPFTDFEKELLNEIYGGLGIQDWRDECIWKTARVENCAIRLAKKYQPKIPEGSVVLSKEEYEKLKSLYDNSQGVYMTSQIGNLPLTVEGLRKAVDEITRLNRVETELQELNAKYYNEAKDLRRENKILRTTLKCLADTRKETAREILKELYEQIDEKTPKWVETQIKIKAKQFGVEVEE